VGRSTDGDRADAAIGSPGRPMAASGVMPSRVAGQKGPWFTDPSCKDKGRTSLAASVGALAARAARVGRWVGRRGTWTSPTVLRMPGNSHPSPTETRSPSCPPPPAGSAFTLESSTVRQQCSALSPRAVHLVQGCPATALVEREEHPALADQRARRAGRRVAPERQCPHRTSGLLVRLGRGHPDVQPVRRMPRGPLNALENLHLARSPTAAAMIS